MGGTKIALALATSEGRVLARLRRPTGVSGSPQRDLERLAADARRLVADAGIELARVRRVGLCVPGPLDAAGEALLKPPNLPSWSGFPIRRALEQALERPVSMENDANAGALAEWRYGAGRGAQDLVYLTMSTGVGAGLVLGGRLHRGAAGQAGEVGHAPVEAGGAACACGLRGCLEAYVGGAAWTRRLREIAPEPGRVAELAGGRAAARPEHVVAAAREGDAFALAELDRFNDYLARGIAWLVFTLAPERVVLGTIPTRAGEALCLAPVRERVERAVWPALTAGLRILPAELGESLPDYAGLCVALEAEAAGPGRARS